MAGTLIVTGCAGGLGMAIATEIVQSPKPYNAVFTVRDASKSNAQPLVSLISTSKDKSRFSTADLDLSNQSQIRSFAASINSRVSSGELKPIRAIILNAAWQYAQGQKFTDDKGYEMNYAVNHLANVLLVLLLLPSIDKDSGRIVFVSSWSHDAKDPYNEQWDCPKEGMWIPPKEAIKPPPDDIKDDLFKKGMARYGQSKLAPLQFMYALQRRMDAKPELKNISALAVDPAAMLTTGMVRSYNTAFRLAIRVVGYVFSPLLVLLSPNGRFRTPAKSARDVLYAALTEGSKTLGEKPKGLFMNGTALSESSFEARDEEKQKVVWEQSLELVGLKDEETLLA